VDGDDQSIEFIAFTRKLTAAGRGQRVKARAAVVF
jgi:hypothetical protein